MKTFETVTTKTLDNIKRGSLIELEHGKGLRTVGYFSGYKIVDKGTNYEQKYMYYSECRCSNKLDVSPNCINFKHVNYLKVLYVEPKDFVNRIVIREHCSEEEMKCVDENRIDIQQNNNHVITKEEISKAVNENESLFFEQLFTDKGKTKKEILENIKTDLNGGGRCYYDSEIVISIELRAI